ncbi:torsin A interacting protein 1, isoform CRA_d, partial [Mus musculus]
VMNEDPISNLCRPPLRSPRLDSTYQTNGNTKTNEREATIVQQVNFFEEGETEDDLESSYSDITIRARSSNSLESRDQDFPAHENQPLLLTSGCQENPQEWVDRAVRMRSRMAYNNIQKSNFGNQSPSTSRPQSAIHHPNEPSVKIKWWLLGLVAILAVGLFWFFHTPAVETTAVQEFQNQMKQLQSKYQSQ